MPLELSPLYPILDASYLPLAGNTAGLTQRLPSDRRNTKRADEEQRCAVLARIVSNLVAAGVTILQYRNKHDPDAQVLQDASYLREQAPRSLRILLNDRVHLVRESGCDGAHIGQTDMSVKDARSLIGSDRILGLSTHDRDQLRAGDLTAADYLAVGPVYATGSKTDAAAVVGLEGVQWARALTKKPLVAIGGITLARAAEVRAAGADSLAVISALFSGPGSAGAGRSLEKLAKDFLKVFR